MPALQRFTALVALGAALLGSLGADALHLLAPHGCSHSAACRPLSCVSAIEQLDRGQAEATQGCQGCGHSHACPRIARDHASPREAADEASRDLPWSSSEARWWSEVAEDSEDRHSVDCAICRHFQHVPLAVWPGVSSDCASLVGLLASIYGEPKPAYRHVGWHSRGPPDHPAALL